MEVFKMICCSGLMYFTLLIAVCKATSDTKRLLINDPDFIMQEINAMKAEIADLKTTKAENVNLNALKADVNSKAEIADLNAMKADIANVNSTKAENANLSSMKAEMSILKSTVSKLQNGGNGAVYTRWGKKTCPGNSTQVYTGFMAGKWYDHAGSGSNYLCLPTDPLWSHYDDNVATYSARIYGAEYESLEFAQSLHDDNAPCSVCRADSATTTLMIPGRNKCYTGWRMEYAGYLVANHYTYQGSEYVCLDSSPDALYGGHSNTDGAILHSVEGICGSLPCPPYVNGRELTCVVCSK